MSQKLIYTECVSIQIYLREKLSHREIGKKLNRSNSSISDEVRKYSINGKYYADVAWIMRHTKRNLVNVLQGKIKRGDDLDTFIVEKIKSYRSPEQIAGDWKNITGKSISKDSIYRHIKRNYPELIRRYFRRGGKKYQYGKIAVDYIFERKSIRERPKEVKLKTEFGHREGDTVRGARKGGFATFTERKSGYELARVLKEKTARNVTNGAYEVFKSLPNVLKKTMTLDNGREFTEHFMRKKLCGLDTYFADVGNPGQRGLNENTNGLIRQFYPKKSDLANVKQEELDYYLELLNNRPRKRLNYLSPKQYLEKYCADLD